MAIKSLIFDYQSEADLYTASDFRAVYKNFMSNGVLLEKTDDLATNTKCKVIAITGGVRISSGVLHINGSQAIITEEEILISTDGTYKIVVEWNIVLNKFVAKAITDATLTRTDTVYQIQLAQVVKSGTTYTVTDKRSDESVCGYANRMLDNQATNLKNQIESGWIPLSGTFTRKSANEITVNTDFTSKLTAGMKIKIVIGSTVTDTIKIVNATTITINNAVLPTVHPITEVCFSMAQTPLGFTVGDYITEIDNSGIWTYEKYNSGKITLKTEVTYTPEQKLVQVPSSNIYATPLEIALPFTLSDVNYDAKIYGVYCYLMGTKITDSTASILRYSLYSGFPYVAGLNGTKCIVEVTGRWK